MCIPIFLTILASVHQGPAPVPSLRDLAARHRLNLGSCVQVGLLRAGADGGRYESAISRELNLVEPENELKPPSIWRARGKYDFSNPDYLLGPPGENGWAQRHRMKVRGHVLVYARDDGYTIPRWLLQSEASITPEQAKPLLHDYIIAVAGRYKGKIAMWDVVNEAIDDRPNDRPFNLRNSFWFRKLGAEFIVLAFKFAHEADPRAELYYNEYGVEGGGRKADAMLALVEYARKNGAPVTGVGLQYHSVLAEHVEPGDGHLKLLSSLQDRKLAFMITELDLGVPVQSFARTDPRRGQIPTDPKDLATQAERYAAIFRMALGFRNCHGVQMWGLTDRYSWIPNYDPRRGAALLLDADYRPKPAYDAVHEQLTPRS